MSQILSAAARAAALTAVLVLVLPGGSRAQETSPPAPAARSVSPGKMRPVHDRRGPQEHVDARIKALHRSLGITPAEEAQWSAVEQVMRENATAIANLAKDRQDKAAGMTAIDDLRSFQALAEAQADGARKLLAAFEPLYAAMSDEQKKTADSVFGHRRPHRHN